MSIEYRHTQFGWVTTIAAMIGLPAIIWLAVYLGVKVLLAVAIISAIPMIGFSTLTTSVDENFFRFRFTIGFGKTIARRDIATCRVVKNPWWYGWGIHRTPDGWLYNVSGKMAVEIGLKSGKRLRVGTDEADALCAALAPSA
jgi:hypothetical protein